MTQSILKEQLKSYGLNPQEWLITKISNQSVWFTKKNQNDFQLFALLSKKKKRIELLELALN